MSIGSLEETGELLHLARTPAAHQKSSFPVPMTTSRPIKKMMPTIQSRIFIDGLPSECLTWSIFAANDAVPVGACRKLLCDRPHTDGFPRSVQMLAASWIFETANRRAVPPALDAQAHDNPVR